MNNVTIITPYVFEHEIRALRDICYFLDVDCIFEQDVNKIGCDLMYQKLWKKAYPNDVIILHSDMSFVTTPQEWLQSLLYYVKTYKEAGIFGCKLLYPEKLEYNYYIQCAGGRFTNNKPDHFGSGIDLFSKNQFKTLEVDVGQYDYLREVAWTTFGGLYIRREVLDAVGDFDPSFEWTYNRDVDYCLSAREKGWKIYQTPVPLFHFESKDVKRIRTQENVAAESRNLNRLLAKWKNSPLFNTLDVKIDEQTVNN